jgi:hypothetical protein
VRAVSASRVEPDRCDVAEVRATEADVAAAARLLPGPAPMPRGDAGVRAGRLLHVVADAIDARADELACQLTPTGQAARR